MINQTVTYRNRYKTPQRFVFGTDFFYRSCGGGIPRIKGDNKNRDAIQYAEVVYI